VTSFKEGKVWELTELGNHQTKTKMNYLLELSKIRGESAS
jgi:hypothetical protein